MNEPQTNHVVDPPSGDVLALLLKNQRLFLSFLQRRAGSREVAEEILQGALAKAVQRAGKWRSAL